MRPTSDGATVEPTVDRQRRGAGQLISLGVALTLAGVLLYYSLRGIEWRHVASIIAGAKPWLLTVAAAISTTSLLLRAIRWRILLNAEGAVPVATAFWAVAAGYFGNNFLPARAGELVRTLMISSRSGLDIAYVLATALSERVADAVALVAIAAVVLLTLPQPPGWLAGAARPFAILALAGVTIIALLPRLEPFGRMLIGRTPLPARLRGKLFDILAHGLRGIRAFHDARRLIAFLALTIVIWSMEAVFTMVTGAALGLSIPVTVALLLVAALGLGSALPSTPGYIGIYQFVAVTVLVPFGFSRTNSIAYILVAQALAYVVTGVWGAIGFLQYRREKP